MGVHVDRTWIISMASGVSLLTGYIVFTVLYKRKKDRKWKVVMCQQHHVQNENLMYTATARERLAVGSKCYRKGFICDQCNRSVSNLDEQFKTCVRCQLDFCRQCFEQCQP